MMADYTRIPGAVADESGLRHLGNPLAEQRALAEGKALAPLGDRRVLSVTGEDRLTWLDSLTSQALADLAPGVSTELLVLDPQGRVEHAASVVDDAETTWLIVDEKDAAGLTSWLTKMRFRLRVDVRDHAGEFAVLGGTAAAIAAFVGAEGAARASWHDPWPHVGPGGHGYAVVAEHPGEQRDWTEAVVPLALLDALVESAAAGAISIAGRDAAEALRVAAWRPRVSADVDERAIPHELDWMRTAVHLAKGCYRGQETVAKVHNLGHPPRRLIALHLDGSGSVLPERGAAVHAGEVAIGAVTSAVLHYEDGPIALALVKRSAPVEGDLLVDTSDGPVAAAQEVIVPPEAGAAASVPRLPRLGRRPSAS